jgi:hypothetical protein
MNQATKERNREKPRETERNREKQRETERNREKQRETERNRDNNKISKEGEVLKNIGSPPYNKHHDINISFSLLYTHK